jgi:hypothetical protein
MSKISTIFWGTGFLIFGFMWGLAKTELLYINDLRAFEKISEVNRERIGNIKILSEFLSEK